MAKTYRYISNTLTGLNTGSQDVTYITQSGVINGTMDIRQDSDNDGAGGQSIRIFGSIYGGIRDNFTSDSGDNYIYVGKTGYVDYMLLSGNGCTVVNTGLISANDGDEGIVLRGALGRQNSNASVVLNSGTISAEDRSAVDISSALGKIKLTNSGILEVASADVNALFANGTQGGTIVNTGTINGDVEFSGSSFVFSTAAGIVNGSITAGSGDDSITGSAYADEIYGGTGGDTILGLAGNDYIDGGAGNNVLEGGTGNDIYVLSVAGTSIAEDSGEGRDRVEASIDYTLGSNIENLTLTGSAIIGKGNSLNNILTGNGASNTLDGRGGVDTMVGLAGGDTYKVDNTGDRVVELAAGGTDTVIASISYTLEIGQEIEILQAKSGASALNLTGNEFANTLIGNDAVNKVSGGSGSDILVGGLGNDILTGGAGADFFVFNAAVGSKNVDTITDFKASDDTIRLDQDIFTEAGSVGSLLASAFYVGAAAHDGTDRIIYNKSTGDLIYDSNGNASGGSVVFAHLKVGLTLTAGDFEIIA